MKSFKDTAIYHKVIQVKNITDISWKDYYALEVDGSYKFTSRNLALNFKTKNEEAKKRFDKVKVINRRLD